MAAMGKMARWRQEAKTAGRFGLVGVLATATHFTVVSCLLQFELLTPQWANLVAYLSAFGVSFWGNHRYTFGAQRDWRHTLGRFWLISLLAYAMNAGVLALLLRFGSVPPMTAALASAACVPAFSFLLSRLWVFKPTAERDPSR